jgi:hypothetical protein
MTYKGYKHSDEAKKKISEAAKRENLSEEIIRKMSDAAKKRKGEANNNHKLTEQEVIEIRTNYDEDYDSFTVLGRFYGVAAITIRKVVNRKTWKHI